MIIKRKHWLLFIIMSFLGVLYIYNYAQLNLSYQKLKTGWDDVYYLGEEVFLGENYIDISMQAKGYSICANTLEIVDTLDYTAENGISLDSRDASIPERLALVSATIRNTDGSDTDLPILLFEMYGIDTYTAIDFELFYSLNPDIEPGNWGLTVQQGFEQEVLIPFRLDKAAFNPYTWNHLDNYALSMRLTYGPARIIIQLTELQ